MKCGRTACHNEAEGHINTDGTEGMAKRWLKGRDQNYAKMCVIEVCT